MIAALLIVNSWLIMIASLICAAVHLLIQTDSSFSGIGATFWSFLGFLGMLAGARGCVDTVERSVLIVIHSAFIFCPCAAFSTVFIPSNPHMGSDPDAWIGIFVLLWLMFLVLDGLNILFIAFLPRTGVRMRTGIATPRIKGGWYAGTFGGLILLLTFALGLVHGGMLLARGGGDGIDTFLLGTHYESAEHGVGLTSLGPNWNPWPGFEEELTLPVFAAWEPRDTMWLAVTPVIVELEPAPDLAVIAEAMVWGLDQELPFQEYSIADRRSDDGVDVMVLDAVKRMSWAEHGHRVKVMRRGRVVVMVAVWWPVESDDPSEYARIESKADAVIERFTIQDVSRRFPRPASELSERDQLRVAVSHESIALHYVESEAYSLAADAFAVTFDHAPYDEATFVNLVNTLRWSERHEDADAVVAEHGERFPDVVFDPSRPSSSSSMEK